MKYLSILMVSVAMLLGGCGERNVITIYNEGDKTWKAVKVSAGGTEHHFDKIESSTKSAYVFKTEVESGGTLIGKLDGKEYQKKFGYFTNNMSTKYEIYLKDEGLIDVKSVQ